MPALNPFSHTFGLDLGDRSFRLIQVTKTRRGPAAYRMVAWNEVEIPEGAIVHGEIKDKDRTMQALVSLLKGAHGLLRGSGVVASLPEAKTFIKVVAIPLQAGTERLRQALREEIEQNIPVPFDDVYYDWQTVERPPEHFEEGHAHEQATQGTEEKTTTKQNVILGAVPKMIVNDYTAIIEAAGLAPVALEMEAMAVARAVIPDAAPPAEPVGILDIGATRSSLVIFDSGAIRMSVSVPTSGDELTQALATAISVSLAEAEKLKRECGLDPARCSSAMRSALTPLIDDMSAKIKNALRFYTIGFPHGRKVGGILLCGGGAQLRGISEALSLRLAVSVELSSPDVNLHPKLPRSFPTNRLLSFATAIGVALSAADRHEELRKLSA